MRTVLEPQSRTRTGQGCLSISLCLLKSSILAPSTSTPAHFQIHRCTSVSLQSEHNIHWLPHSPNLRRVEALPMTRQHMFQHHVHQLVSRLSSTTTADQDLTSRNRCLLEHCVQRLSTTSSVKSSTSSRRQRMTFSLQSHMLVHSPRPASSQR